MNTWNLAGTNGISIGGEWYGADKNGNVTVPDYAGDLSVYGFTIVPSKADLKEQAKIDETGQTGAEAAAAANAEVSKQVTEATAAPVNLADATVAAVALAHAPAA